MKKILLTFKIFCCFLVAYGQNATDGGIIFKQKCTSCHTIGKGKLIGPDLKGVTTRREEAWLKKQIKTPNVMIAENDPIATQLVKEANGVQMAPLGLSDDEVNAVIAFLKNSEQQTATVSTGLPSEYMPTVLISLGMVLVLTVIGWKWGSKKVEVR